MGVGQALRLFDGATHGAEVCGGTIVGHLCRFPAKILLQSLARFWRKITVWERHRVLSQRHGVAGAARGASAL